MLLVTSPASSCSIQRGSGLLDQHEAALRLPSMWYLSACIGHGAFTVPLLGTLLLRLDPRIRQTLSPGSSSGTARHLQDRALMFTHMSWLTAALGACCVYTGKETELPGFHQHEGSYMGVILFIAQQFSQNRIYEEISWSLGVDLFLNTCETFPKSLPVIPRRRTRGPSESW